MADEQLSELPEELDSWVRERAEDTGMDPEEVLARSVAAYRFLDGESDSLAHGGEGEADSAVALGVAESDFTEMTERLEDLEERVGGVESALEEKVDDVRERIIQVKREADSKAETDHDHGDLRERVEAAGQAATDARDAAQGLQDRVDRIDKGFDNFEDILEYLTETTDDLEAKLTRLARVSIDLRETLNDLEGQVAARSVAADLQEKANREGISKAKCENCETKVTLGLLATPHCPDCGRTFSDLQPASGFLGSATLVVGDRPALESAGSTPPETPETPDELFEDAGEDGASENPSAGGGSREGNEHDATEAAATSEEAAPADDASGARPNYPSGATSDGSTAARTEATDGSGKRPESGGVDDERNAHSDDDSEDLVDDLFEDA